VRQLNDYESGHPLSSTVRSATFRRGPAELFDEHLGQARERLVAAMGGDATPEADRMIIV
jgi:hypothetical protein